MQYVKTSPLIILCTLLLVIVQSSLSQDTPELITAIRQGKIEEVKKLVKKGADVNLVYNKRHTPLMTAIYGGNLDIIKLLVDKGADVNLKTEKGGTALTVAASMGSQEVCDLLISQKADIEAVDNEGKTPLMNAVYNKQKELANYLIEKGADVNAKEPNGWTALMFAAMLGETESVKNLIKALNRRTPMAFSFLAEVGLLLRNREPMTKSALPCSKGVSKSGNSSGRCEPSESIVAIISPFAFMKPTRRA